MTKFTYLLIVFWTHVFYICCACKTLEWTNTIDLNFYGRVFQVFIVSVGIIKPIWHILKTGYETIQEYKEFVKEKAIKKRLNL